MQRVDWKSEFRNLFGLLALAIIVGWPLGILPWALWLATSAYVVWILIQLRRIKIWFIGPDNVEPPISSGLFGDVLDGIYRMHKQGSQERIRLQAQLEYLRASFASLDDGAVMLDSNGYIEWSNSAAERMLGLRYPQDQQQLITHLIRQPEFIHYYEGGVYYESLQINSSVNEHLDLQINITYFGEGSRLLFARDITETNRLQEMRRDFVANVSHELRTPLTVINGYLQTMADMFGSSVVKDELRWRRAIDQMLAQSQRMENLIKDLIVLSRLESIPEIVEQEPINLLPMLEMIREEVLEAVKGCRTILIDCDDSISLLGSSDELRSAFANLVMNAAKYTSEDGEIRIRWFHDKHNAYLSVEDNGEGIDDHHLPRLTERFYRVDKSRSIDTGGTGLGLAIVKHIMLHHQAELQISSSLGEGSCFTCVFPINRMLSHSHTA